MADDKKRINTKTMRTSDDPKKKMGITMTPGKGKKKEEEVEFTGQLGKTQRAMADAIRRTRESG